MTVKGMLAYQHASIQACWCVGKLTHLFDLLPVDPQADIYDHMNVSAERRIIGALSQGPMCVCTPVLWPFVPSGVCAYQRIPAQACRNTYTAKDKVGPTRPGCLLCHRRSRAEISFN